MPKSPKELIEERIRELEGEDSNARWLAAKKLEEYALERGYDIKAAIPALVIAANDPRSLLSALAGGAIQAAAKTGTDISDALDMLIKDLETDQSWAKVAPLHTIGMAATGTDISATIGLLADIIESEKGPAKIKTTEAIAKAAENGFDISVAIPNLRKALDSDDKELAVFAAEALAAIEKDLEGSRELLQKIAKKHPEQKKELAEAYIRIVKAIKKPEMAGIVLDPKIKPPKDGRFRMRRAYA